MLSIKDMKILKWLTRQGCPDIYRKDVNFGTKLAKNSYGWLPQVLAAQ